MSQPKRGYEGTRRAAKWRGYFDISDLSPSPNERPQTTIQNSPLCHIPHSKNLLLKKENCTPEKRQLQTHPQPTMFQRSHSIARVVCALAIGRMSSVVAGDMYSCDRSVLMAFCLDYYDEYISQKNYYDEYYKYGTVVIIGRALSVTCGKGWLWRGLRLCVHLRKERTKKREKLVS